MHKLAPLKLASPHLQMTGVGIPRQLIDGFGAIHIKAPLARASALVDAIGLPRPLATAELNRLEVLWMGPGEWLAIASRDDLIELSAFESLIAKSGVATVRCDSRLAILQLLIPSQIVSALTGLPACAIAPGHVVRTRMADLAVTITCAADGTFRLLFDRSYASHMCAWLDRAT